jgi:hypothetical protein
LRAAHPAVSLHHIEVRILSPRQVGFELRCAGSKFSSFKLRLGAMLGRLSVRLKSSGVIGISCVSREAV